MCTFPLYSSKNRVPYGLQFHMTHSTHCPSTLKLLWRPENHCSLSIYLFLFRPVCMPSQRLTTISSSICGTGLSTTSQSRQENYFSEPTLSCACLRFTRCGRRRASRAALTRAISETTATEQAVCVTSAFFFPPSEFYLKYCEYVWFQLWFPQVKALSLHLHQTVPVAHGSNWPGSGTDLLTTETSSALSSTSKRRTFSLPLVAFSWLGAANCSSNICAKAQMVSYFDFFFDYTLSLDISKIIKTIIWKKDGFLQKYCVGCPWSTLGSVTSSLL